MINSVLELLHHAVTLLFGVYISAAFLGIRMSRKNIAVLGGFSAAVGAVSTLSFVFFEEIFTTQIYPLIIHLPLILFLTFFYKYTALSSTLSVLTAYLCCQISKWVGLAILSITDAEWVYYSVRIVTTVVVFAVIIRYVSNAAAQLIQKPTEALLIFAILPFAYYLFDYATGVYTALIYSGNKVVVEFLGFALSIAYLLFLLVYFKQYEEKRETEQRSHILEMQREQYKREIEAQKRSANALSLLRHDMRHFCVAISAYIDSGEYDKAKEYISGIISHVDRTATHKFCKNEIVNMILSSYENVMKENQIDFKTSICIPEQLPVSDVDLTSILSNALENAIHAMLPLETENRHITLHLRTDDGKLLISLKNTFAENPVLTDGIPNSSKEGHGYGTQSIRYVTEKLKGNCQFSVKDGWFILRIVL